MPKCASKNGFYVLMDCGAPAVAQCRACQRPMCAGHLIGQGSDAICFDCSGKMQARSGVDPTDALQTSERMLGVRHLFYAGTGYRPIFDARRGAAYYSDYDVRSFARRDDGTSDDGDIDLDDDPGFMDS